MTDDLYTQYESYSEDQDYGLGTALEHSAKVAAMNESRIYFNVETHEISVGDSKPKPAKNWRVIPKQVGIIWHDDQSDNQMVFNWARSQHPDYIFDPRDDMNLLLEYTDQLPDLF